MGQHLCRVVGRPGPRVKSFVAIAGNIGVGKSTLTALLSQRLGWEPFFEAVDANPYLSDFYEDMERWSFHSQIYFLSRRLRHHWQLLQRADSVVQDRTVYEDAEVFACNLHQRGWMDGRDYESYSELYQVVTAVLPPPDLIVYLRASVPTLEERIRKRGRSFERKIPTAYLGQLNELYERWVEGFDLCPILIVPTDALDLAGNDSHRELIVEEVLARLSGGDEVLLTKDRSPGVQQDPPFEATLRELTFLYETSRLLAGTRDLDEVLRLLMSQVRDYFQVTGVSVALLDEEAGELSLQADVGEMSGPLKDLRLAPDEGIPGLVAQSGKAILIPDAYGHPRFSRIIDDRTGFRTEVVLAVPIKTDHGTIGVIEAFNPVAGCFDERAPALLAQLARQAATAIGNARLFRSACEAERRYERLFHASPAPTVIIDHEGRIIDLNGKAGEVLGGATAELIGSSWPSLLAEAEAEIGIPWEDLWARDRVATEMNLSTPGGARVYEVQMTAIEYGGRPAVEWIGHDITERVELERMRDDLAQMIVHDLRNPLANVVSGLQVIHTAVLEEDETVSLIDVLNMAMRSSEKLHRLIDSLLDIRRLELGRGTLDKVLVHADLLAQEAVELVLPVIKRKRQELVLDIPPGLPPLYVDRDLTARVLTNLLDNAAKFTPPDGTISIEAVREDEALVFTVSDNGPGVAPGREEQLFEAFTRLENARGTRGTGLGLSFCKLAVEAHGGKIWVDSESGEGSHFRFRLPLEER